jgi:hypothetical protein
MENKVTKMGIQEKIVDQQYIVLPDGRSTLCILTLQNGFTVKGFSACVDIDNFDLIMGRDIAFEDAFRQIWVLEGYLLAEKLYWDRALPVATNPKKIVAQNVMEQINAEFDEVHKTWSAEVVKVPKRKSKKAPWGLKKDGTPKQRPGRKPA